MQRVTEMLRILQPTVDGGKGTSSPEAKSFSRSSTHRELRHGQPPERKRRQARAGKQGQPTADGEASSLAKTGFSAAAQTPARRVNFAPEEALWMTIQMEQYVHTA